MKYKKWQSLRFFEAFVPHDIFCHPKADLCLSRIHKSINKKTVQYC